MTVDQQCHQTDNKSPNVFVRAVRPLSSSSNSEEISEHPVVWYDVEYIETGVHEP